MVEIRGNMQSQMLYLANLLKDRDAKPWVYGSEEL